MRRNMPWWQISNPTGESPDHLHLRSSKQQLHIFAPPNKIQQTKTSEADGFHFLKLFLSDARGRWDPLTQEGAAGHSDASAHRPPRGERCPSNTPTGRPHSRGCEFCCPWTNGFQSRSMYSFVSETGMHGRHELCF